MANQPSPYKQIIGARIDRELYCKVETLAKKYKLTMSQLLVMILERETRDIELTEEQYEQIAREIRAAKAGAMPRKSTRSRKTGHLGENF